MRNSLRVDYPVIGGKYQHYKGGLYEVISMANHTETAESMVVYKSLLFGGVYVRPLSSWNENIAEFEKLYNVSRFRLIK